MQQALFDSFIKEGRYLRGWSPRTAAIYEAAYANFTRFQQSLRQDASAMTGSGIPIPVSKTQLGAWIVWMREQGFTAGGCNVNIRSINSFLSWLNEEGHIENPLRAKLLKNHPAPLPTFSDAEIQKLSSFKTKNPYQHRAWVLTLTLLDTGIRMDEALGLEQKKVDLDDLNMRVLGKGSKERVVPFSVSLRRRLFPLVSKQEGKFVFQTTEGQRLMYRNAYRDIKRVCGLAGVTGEKVHPHAFRHYFAVNYISRGGDIYRLSRILGHTNISTTQLYLRSMTAEQVQQAHLSPLVRTA
jgi:integrase/recombinase XerD